MRRAAKLASMPSRDRILLLRAVFLLGSAFVLLRLFNWNAALRRFSHAVAKSRGTGGQPSPERITWAVRAVSTRLPLVNNCLVQSLALRSLLAQHGYASELRIGVAQPTQRKLDAHAWVEREGRVLIGEKTAGGFTPLTFPKADG